MVKKGSKGSSDPVLAGPLGIYLSGVFLGEWNVILEIIKRVSQFSILRSGGHLYLAWSILAGPRSGP